MCGVYVSSKFVDHVGESRRVFLFLYIYVVFCAVLGSKMNSVFRRYNRVLLCQVKEFSDVVHASTSGRWFTPVSGS